MQSIAGAHGVFRTQLLLRGQAERFAACLQANRQYTDVQLLESRQAQHPAVRWFVRYRPTDQSRAANLLARRQRERLQRAEEEGPDYVWIEDPHARPGREFFHLQALGGNTYEVDGRGRWCSCPDYQGTCRRAGLRCKHLLAWDLGLGTFLGREDLAEPCAA